jgi:peptidoglycan/xylan/chitin deacetylase (PgdA/CDA1 family)
LLILCYHGVSLDDEHEWDPGLYVSQERLRDRLRLLARLGCNVLPLDDAARRLQSGRLPPRAVAITFDDGVRDFAQRAVPVLTEFGFPATVYVTTYYADKAMPVFDPALGYLLWAGRASGADLGDFTLGGSPRPLDSDAARTETWRAICEFATARALSAAGKHELLRAVATTVGIDFDAFVASGKLQVMTAAELRALPANLVSVELHTHRHRTPSSEPQFVDEIRDNREALDRLLGAKRDYRHFCYPSGEYAHPHLAWLQQCGVLTATTCVPGLASATDNALLLPRFVDTQSVPQATFEAWVTGLAAWLPRGRAGRPVGTNDAGAVAGPAPSGH